MEELHTKAYTIKIQNFEGPFDLLFHLIEKNQFNIYDIPISDITDQYMDYLSQMQELDLDIASEFLVMAATLLHIKSKLLLPDKKEKIEDEIDPKEDLIIRLIEYKKYKDFSHILKEREAIWGQAFYKEPELIEFKFTDEILELSDTELKRVYFNLLKENSKKINKDTGEMKKIIQHEKISLKSKMNEILKVLLSRTFIQFSEMFSLKRKSKVEVVTGFLAILELAKVKKIKILQKKQFSKILLIRAANAEKEQLVHGNTSN